MQVVSFSKRLSSSVSSLVYFATRIIAVLYSSHVCFLAFSHVRFWFSWKTMRCSWSVKPVLTRYTRRCWTIVFEAIIPVVETPLNWWIPIITVIPHDSFQITVGSLFNAIIQIPVDFPPKSPNFRCLLFIRCLLRTNQDKEASLSLFLLPLWVIRYSF